jgi:hypothetical protein
MSTSLDPKIERDELEPLVSRYNEARTEGDNPAMDRLSSEIRRVLLEELERRFRLVEATIGVLRRDERVENAAVAELVKTSLDEHWFQYRRMEGNIFDAEDGPAFVTSAETDWNSAAAASRFFVYESSAEARDLLLVHDDRDLQAQFVASGIAIDGVIRRVTDEGEGRSHSPVWQVSSSGGRPLRLKVGDRVCVVGLSKRWGIIRRIESGDAKVHFEIVIRGLPTRPRGADGLGVPKAFDMELEGKPVMMVEWSMAGIARFKSAKVWKRDVPGKWLTNPPRQPLVVIDTPDEPPASSQD